MNEPACAWPSAAKAMVYFALRRPDLAEPFREYLESLDLTPAKR